MFYRQHKQYRLKSHDYSSNGVYFITICTHNRKQWFGEIHSGVMDLSNIGKIVADEWLNTGRLRSHMILDEWVIMPDHFHGIIIIHNDLNYGRRNAPRRVPTFGIQPLITNSIASIINHFKGAVTRIAHLNGYPGFHWQSRYYDRIIRTERELQIVRKYIQNNPRNWKK